jgi:hypothetical protein
VGIISILEEGGKGGDGKKTTVDSKVGRNLNLKDNCPFFLGSY